MYHEWMREGYVISTDPRRLEVGMIHQFLTEESYWAKGIARAVVEKAIANSLCFGLYGDGGQAGFARVITDYATYGYLNDVFVAGAQRGRGLGKWLLECVIMHPDLAGLRRFGLTTRDGQALYARYGWTALHYPERHMERLPADYYQSVG
jgi:GNAT superfamily N-acetyltransferase